MGPLLEFAEQKESVDLQQRGRLGLCRESSSRDWVQAVDLWRSDTPRYDPPPPSTPASAAATHT